QHISLFVAGVKDKVSLKLIAAKGKVQLQAQSDAMELTADKDVAISSLSASQLFNGKKEVLLTCGGAYICIKDGKIELHAPGKVSFKGGSHDWSGPAKMTPAHPSFPQHAPTFPLSIKVDQSPLGVKSGWGGMPYKLYADGALQGEGVIDEQGHIQVEHRVPVQKYKLELANGVVYDIPVAVDYHNPAQGDAANAGFHKHIAGPAPDGGRDEHQASAREDFLALFKPADKGE
ncbi:DUF2345 domain-containing protein, partial [Vogesella oryzae]|uniref:DUF2345 domain-containing protein n=1 Tax=Vogesella oryzae TaxID=1735285 RepID=UPI001FE2824F